MNLANFCLFRGISLLPTVKKIFVVFVFFVVDSKLSQSITRWRVGLVCDSVEIGGAEHGQKKTSQAIESLIRADWIEDWRDRSHACEAN